MTRKQLTPVKRILTKLFPERWLRQQARATGAVKRRRKVDIVALFWTLVLGFGLSDKRTLAELRRHYERLTGTALEESSFYERFTTGLALLLRAAVLRGLQLSQELGGSSVEVVAFYKEILAIDTTVIRLHELLRHAYAGTRTNHSPAAAKLHVVLNVLRASAKQVRLSPERTDDRSPWQRLGRWVQGRLLLFDLGYFCYALFARIDDNEGFFLTRLKSNSNPLIVNTNLSWRGRARKLQGQRLKAALPHLKRKVLDAQVQVHFERRPYRGKARRAQKLFRLVALYNEQHKRYHLYLTNIPPARLSARQVGEVYRLRWQVELLFKELRSHYRLDQLPSSKRPVVEALVYAALVTLVVSRKVLQELRRRQPPGRFVPPLRWAAVFCGLAPRLLEAMHPSGRASAQRVDLYELLLAQALDPHVGRPTAPQRLLEPRARAKTSSQRLSPQHTDKQQPKAA